MMEKRLQVFALVIFAAVLTLESPAGASQLDKIRERGYLISGADFESAPFSMIKDGSPVGYDADLAKAIADKIGVELKLAVLPWEGGITLAWSDGYDWSLFDIACNNVTVTEARSAKCLFSKPYYVTGLMMVAINKEGGVKSHSDAKGKTIGILEGSTADVGVELLGAEPLPFETNDLIVKAILDGIIDVGVMDGSLAKSFTENNPSLSLIEGFLTKEEFAVAMPQGETELAEIINQAIDEQKEALEAKWLK